MKASLYFTYTSRSLVRGGQRTMLAVFCVAVGVMAVVGLQLVGFMLQSSLTSNVRETNGGDIALTAPGSPLKASDLSFFAQLKSAGRITNYTSIISANGALNAAASSTQSFGVEAVNPANYPLVSQPTFIAPSNGGVAQLLTHNQVIVTQHFLDKYQKHLGDALTVYVKTSMGLGQTLSVTISGVVDNTGIFAQSGNLLLISIHDYLATAPTALSAYSLIDITTVDQAHTDATVKAINAQFPLAVTSTVADVLQSEQSSVDLITKFLEVAGLIALLIGGVGIVNTMQVMLSRRKTEIAMLKTAGYQRKDLYLLFGLEASLLGLIGGIVGAAAAIGVSYLVRILMQNTGVNVPFILNTNIILSGIVIGCITALIFGLMPIVQAANVRPLHVIREFENKGVKSIVLTIFLLIVLSILFCAVAIVILNNNVMLGIVTTYSTLAFLLVLSGFFGLVILTVSKLPVPERFHFKQLLLILVGVAISALVYWVQPVFGLFLLAASLLGVVVALLPRTWKVSTKMALRSLGRRRARTATTMLALFIGIFGIGLVVGVGQDLQTVITKTLAANEPYNIVAATSGQDSRTLQAQWNSIAGVSSRREDPFTAALPVAINGQPSQQALPAGTARQQDLATLGGIEGYNLTQTLPAQTITLGRNLNASDANTNNIIVSQMMTSKGWLGMNLKPGDTIVFSSADGKIQRTATIVGIISVGTSFETLGRVLASNTLVNALNTNTSTSTSVFYMQVASTQVNAALDMLNRIVPNAAIQNLSDTATSFLQELDSILSMLVGIASLSVLAAVIIIANAVALAMLERKRELGILKSVGYTSGTILSEVLIENGLTGGTGAFIAMLLAAGGVPILGRIAFNSPVNMEPFLVVSLVLGPALLAMIVAALVAWKAVRVRPLEVLRYE